MVKITAIRVIGLDTPGDGCVIRINTDAGLVGYRERGAARANGPFNPTLDGTDLRRAAKSYANIREAVGDDIDIALHLTGQFDTRSAIGLRTALDRGPADRPLFRSLARTQVFRARAPPRRRKGRDGRWLPAHLDNQALDTIHPDVSYSSGITAGRQIVGYASLTRTAIGLYSGPSPSPRPRRTSSRWKMRSAPSVEMKKRWRKAPRPSFGKASSPSPKDLG
jgi:hypothetical protein